MKNQREKLKKPKAKKPVGKKPDSGSAFPDPGIRAVVKPDSDDEDDAAYDEEWDDIEDEDAASSAGTSLPSERKPESISRFSRS